MSIASPTRQITPSSRPTIKFSFAFPLPLISAKNGERMAKPTYSSTATGIYVMAISSTCGSLLNRPKMVRGKQMVRKDSSAAKARSMTMDTPMIFGTRWYFSAPRFCPTMELPAVDRAFVTTAVMEPSLLPTPVTAEATTP